MADPVAETRPADDAAPVADAIPEETSKTDVAGDVEAEAKANDDAAAPAEADLESEVDDDIKSKKVTLADLSAKGTALYAQKKYEGAADIFSRASVLQAEINGETAPENAEILFHYGRSLFKVGQSKSDVLGGSAPAPVDKKTKANGGTSSKKAAKPDEEKGTAATATEQPAEGKEKGDEKSDVPEGKKLFFQFTGDENFDDESDEDEGQEEGDQDEEEDDDLATAFEILDLARVCYHKQLEKLREEEEAEGKGKETAKEDSSAVRHIKERLAETHDCLAEISLENERYPNAIEDGRTSLNYKIDLYPEESEIIAEAHYKLSLALEFASLTVADDEGKNTKREEIDQTLRDEAVVEMEAAIKSFRLKMQTIEVEIASSASPEDNELSRKAVEEMKEVIADLEQRLVDLKKDPLSTSDLLSEGVNPLGGLLGAALGGSAAEVQARVEEASKNAVDLSSLVRKKKPKNDEDATPANGGGKRKADEESTELESKKAKVVEEQPAEAEK